MIIKTLYKYTREDGGITVSPTKPEVEYTEKYRVIASKGMRLSKVGFSGNPYCIDVDSQEATEGWTEIADPNYRERG